MYKSLQSLADIRTGYSFRSKIEHDPLGVVPVLQIRDISRGNRIVPEQLPRMRWPVAGEPPYLEPGSIVLPARGDHYDAAFPPEGIPIVASSQLFVLKPKGSNVLPQYLCWYLNQPKAQNYLLNSRAGTSIPMLNKQTLGLLPVSVPPLQTQRKILALQELCDQEQQLTQQLMINRQKMLEGVFAKLLES